MTARIDIQKENQNLIGLAVKCRLISVDQEQEILSRLIEKYPENPEYPVSDVLIEQGILSREEIKFLFTVKDHLRIKMLDKRFGEIGVSNRFVNSEAVEKALEIQNACFQKNRESKKIGDILLENKEISLANKTAILLTQDRIQDHLLEQAMNDIATSEMEKMTIKMRFGAIAVKKGLISVDQLNQALHIQNQEEKSGKKKRYLGEIFQDIFNIPSQEIVGVLRIQREMETKRLSLERAISRYTSEVRMNKRLNDIFQIHVAEDKMGAFLHRTKTAFERIDLPLFHNWIKLNGIRFGICSDDLLESFLNESEPGASLELARGVSPTPSRDEVVEFFFLQEKPSTIRKGEILARITPHEFGQPGRDVMDHPVPPREPRFLSLACGDGVIRKDLEFIADRDGKPILVKNRTLFVTPAAQNRPGKILSGHILSDTMDAHDTANLKIEGSIKAPGVITCHDLFVSGDILGNVFTTGHVEVKGGVGMEITDPAPGQYPTRIHSRGSVFVSKHITNASIVTARGFTAPRSDLTGSEVCALQDIVVKNVYSQPGRPSVLQIGAIPELKNDSLERRIQKHKERLRELRCEDELNVLNAKLQEKIQIQDEYHSRQKALNHLLTRLEGRSLKQVEEEIPTLSPGKAGSGKKDTPLFPAHDLKYMRQILRQIRAFRLEDPKDFLTKELADVSRIFRAAVHSTERFSIEHRARIKFLMKKMDQRQTEIDRAGRKLKALLIRKDYFSLDERNPARYIEPVIKVKNMVEKNTIIKGRNASMIIRQSIFGVKIREIKDPSTNEYEIVIDGYYD